mmetsp:Transcript_78974/g.245294  ORF Transcript_78974/g.245294 Transcript_78974/m.245294 type:complete len:206 (-) Transcript_78974:3-620(-)
MRWSGETSLVRRSGTRCHGSLLVKPLPVCHRLHGCLCPQRVCVPVVGQALVPASIAHPVRAVHQLLQPVAVCRHALEVPTCQLKGRHGLLRMTPAWPHGFRRAPFVEPAACQLTGHPAGSRSHVAAVSWHSSCHGRPRADARVLPVGVGPVAGQAASWRNLRSTTTSPASQMTRRTVRPDRKPVSVYSAACPALVHEWTSDLAAR